jgi:hypothetical protein
VDVRRYGLSVSANRTQKHLVRLLCLWPHIGDGDAYIGASKWTVRCEHLGSQFDRQGKACPIAKGQAERRRRWPKVAYNERLGRSERPDIEM